MIIDLAGPMLSSLDKIVQYGISGIGPFSGASDLAQKYLDNSKHRNHDSRVRSLTRREAGKNFGIGFLTNLGGLITLPIAIPAAVAASLVIRSRLCGAIAIIFGHDVFHQRVKVLVSLSLVGEQVAKEVLKKVGVPVGQTLTREIINKITGVIFKDIQEAVAEGTIRAYAPVAVKEGGRSFFRRIGTRAIPFAGGVFGGAIDAAACLGAAKAARAFFDPDFKSEPGNPKLFGTGRSYRRSGPHRDNISRKNPRIG